MSTKYELIINYIKTEIEGGNFKDKLPSIRALAIKFSCSNSTVIRAYSELEKENIIYALPKSGYFVVDNQLNSFGIVENGQIDLSSGEPCSSILPYEEFQECINSAISRYKQSIFAYGNSCGFEPFKQTVCTMFEKNNIKSSIDRIMISSGAQQALSILSLMPFPNGKKSILIEQPTYNIYLKWLTEGNLNIHSIKRNFDGIDMNELEDLFKNKDIKFFYTMPRLQNPLGTSYGEEEKKQIAYLAEKYDVYILEDDYLSDLNDSPSMPIASYDNSQKVIYIKSFSKILMPSIRLAACSLPENLADTFDSYGVYMDLVSGVPFQAALNLYITNGYYSNYINVLKKFYKNKMRILKNQFEKFTALDLKFFIPDNGLYTSIELPDSINAEELINNLNSRDVDIRNINYFYLKDFNFNKGFRISVTKPSEDMIIKAIDILYSEMDKMLSSNSIKKNTLLEI